MADYLKSPSKSSLLAMLKQASSITPKFMRSLLDGVAFKSDLAKLNQDDNQQTSKYIYSSTVGGIFNFKRDWEDLTDGGATTLHKHDHGGMDGLGDAADHTWAALVDGTRNITGTQKYNADLQVQTDTGVWRNAVDGTYVAAVEYIAFGDSNAVPIIYGSGTRPLYQGPSGSKAIALYTDTLYKPIATETAATVTVGESYYTILCDGTSNTVTVNLPAAASYSGRIYNIKAINIDNAVTVSPNGSEEIDGSNSDITLALMEIITVQSDGSNWWII